MVLLFLERGDFLIEVAELIEASRGNSGGILMALLTPSVTPTSVTGGAKSWIVAVWLLKF